MLNKQRCKGTAGAFKQVHKDASREGNAVKEGDGKTGMEYKQVTAKPLGKGKLVNWDK